MFAAINLVGNFGTVSHHQPISISLLLLRLHRALHVFFRIINVSTFLIIYL
jgi:hypothetical protein